MTSSALEDFCEKLTICCVCARVRDELPKHAGNLHPIWPFALLRAEGSTCSTTARCRELCRSLPKGQTAVRAFPVRFSSSAGRSSRSMALTRPNCCIRWSIVCPRPCTTVKICCRGRGHRRAEGHDQEVKGAGLGKIRLPVIGSDAEFV